MIKRRTQGDERLLLNALLEFEQLAGEVAHCPCARPETVERGC